MTNSDTVSAYLAGKTPAHEALVHWPGGLDVRLRDYLTGETPPLELVSSVRAVVLRGGEVMVVRDPDSVHLLPGGRREDGESLEETVVREVLEETGWRVRPLRLIGMRHLRRLGPPPPDDPRRPTDFLQPVFAAEAVEYRPEARQADGRETDARFLPLGALDELDISPADRVFLVAALHGTPA